MTINNVVDFVTSKERLEKLKGEMILAYFDYKDNTGSSDAGWFWRDFDEKRKRYLDLKLIVEGPEENDRTE